MSDELGALIERIKSKTYTDSDVKTLEELIVQRSVSQNTSQRGRYNVSVKDLSANAGSIHIGDRGFTSEDIRLIVREIAAQRGIDEEVSIADYSSATEEPDIPLSLLSVRPETVNHINSRLKTLDELQNSGCLSESERAKFNSIKIRISTIEEKNQELKSIYNKVDKILDEAIESLSKKLKGLKVSRDENLYDARARICTQQYIEILEEFQAELRQGKVVARWLDLKKKDLTSSIVEHILVSHPNIVSSSSSRKLELFTISIRQFIERICTCLELGNSNSLENPATPTVFGKDVYSEAFEQLQRILPTHMPEGGRYQLSEYVDYIKKNFKNYRRIDIH